MNNANGNGSSPVMGGLNEKCLGNALDMTWLDWTKPTAVNVQGEAL